VEAFINDELHLGFKLVEVKLDWSARRTRSRGGERAKGSFISIAMNRYVQHGPYKYYEYKSFHKSHIIGGFDHVDYTLPLKSVICHEIAHALDAYGKTYTSPHGESWKGIYTQLRKKFINPHIDYDFSFDAEEPKKKEDIGSLYLAHCESKGLRRDWIGSRIYITNKQYTIKGWNPRARKNFVIVERTNDHKEFVMTPADIKHYMEKSYENPIHVGLAS
tara:strand:+ start:3594 stop:4250 length:657 start_codon:yes stop_codon:yes gene_type:complete